ncbi:hypothetical protein G6M50_07720 [Agrobacterium rhizogenes]|jgi:hypothetical protein|nr:hypothetical protein [Rhizobium rhizogenes]NTJ77686.1 hypothetical protein [Rhizobium rhizogenes]
MHGLHGFSNGLAAGTMMERLKRLTQDKLSQREIEILNRIFNAVTAQSWFDDTDYSREGFAVGLVGLFQYGIVNPTQLERIAMFWAWSDFPQNMSDTQRAKLKSLYSRHEVRP